MEGLVKLLEMFADKAACPRSLQDEMGIDIYHGIWSSEFRGNLTLPDPFSPEALT